MSGMFLTQDTPFISLAIGTVLVVATAGVGALTVLPAAFAGQHRYDGLPAGQHRYDGPVAS